LQDDGNLSASEIAGLRLGAGWVVLSATPRWVGPKPCVAPR
jgi:hypothetical protein